MIQMDKRQQIQKSSAEVERKLRHHIKQGHDLCIIKAPPGSGKTHTLVHAVAYAAKMRRRIAVGAQTNAQADDLCRRYAAEYPTMRICRFAANGRVAPGDLPTNVTWVTSTRELPEGDMPVVSTAAKWSLVSALEPFDFLFVDEAWQMAWCDFMLLQQVASKFVLIGDPGQIPPVVTIPTQRWETSPRAPHRSAPQLLLEDPGILKLSLDLPCCRRLPSDSVELVRQFYDFHFDAWAMPGERYCRSATPKKLDPIDRAINVLADRSIAIATLPTPLQGLPINDSEIVGLAVRFAERLIDRKLKTASHDDQPSSSLTPADIGISATHRLINRAIEELLPARFRDPILGIRVDTPERWQGLERKVMIVVHPLSGVTSPSPFDLETGRLCVMASRHRSGLIVLSRDHVPEMLDSYIPSATQAIGRDDLTGRGHFQNAMFWDSLAKSDCVIPIV